MRQDSVTLVLDCDYVAWRHERRQRAPMRGTLGRKAAIIGFTFTDSPGHTREVDVRGAGLIRRPTGGVKS